MQPVNNQELQFPVQWNYKIITEKKSANVVNEICQILKKFGIEEQPVAGRESSSGKYLTYKLTVTFNSRENMEELSEAIAHAPGVKFLL
jgi:putative lipoic acid-binding regulatory protein